MELIVIIPGRYNDTRHKSRQYEVGERLETGKEYGDILIRAGYAQLPVNTQTPLLVESEPEPEKEAAPRVVESEPEPEKEEAARVAAEPTPRTDTRPRGRKKVEG